MSLAGSSTALLLAILGGSAAAVWLAGAPLSRSTDALTDRFHLGQALGGLLLLAVATNLPEVAIVTSAALRGDMAMAIGNLLGGIAAQTMVLVAIDRWGVRKGPPLLSQASTPALQVEALLVMVLLTLVVAGRQLAPATRLGPLTAGDMLVPIAWIGGIVTISRLRPAGPAAPPSGAARQKAPVPVFALASLVTLAGGAGLELAGNALATRAGINGVLFGATVLAAATSLPELSTGIAAARAGERELAVSDILGGNAVLPGLLLLVTLLAGRSAFAAIDPTSLLLCGLGTVMTAVCAGGAAIRSQRRVWGVGIEGLVLIGLYGTGMAGVAALAQ